MLFPLRKPGYKRAVGFLATFTLIICFFLFGPRLIDDFAFFDKPAVVPQDPPGAWSRHPVVLLHQQAQEKFDALLQRQSRTPDEAAAEYSRRYGRAPPPGFHQWAEYALAQESPIIDDFDTLSSGVHRFFGLTAAQIALRMRAATDNSTQGFHNDKVERCVFTKERFGDGCGEFAEPLTTMLGDARRLAPDVEFLVNFLDEPSVLLSQRSPGPDSASPWRDLSHQSIAAAVAEACELRLNSTRIESVDEPIQTYGLPFVQDVRAATDLCRHPEYASNHGFLMSPDTFMHMPVETPILSQGAPYPFSDILYPSTYYGLESHLYKQSDDRLWDSKKNGIYWAGSSTGGHWSHYSWLQGHRQRLAILGMHKEERDFTYLRSSAGAGAGIVEPYTSAAFDSSLYDFAVTRIIGCDDDDADCHEQGHFFGIPWLRHPESRPLRYRLALDIDGNSYSGRYYRFLASRSVPLKLTVFREWHDDRLVPWLHYVPVSLTADELPELVRFLATTTEGQRVGRRIAEAGREWYFRAMTRVHQGIYMYRLMLELAWMQDESRPAG